MATPAKPAARDFVRSLPSPAEAPTITIDDYTPASEREEILNALADEGAQMPGLRHLARWCVIHLTLQLKREPTDLEIAQCLLDRIHQLVEYGDDTSESESYSRCSTTLVPIEGAAISPITGEPKGRGDCDDLGTLFCALCRAVGISSNVIWVDQPGAAFNHVAAVVCASGDRCYWVESTIPGARVGETTQEAINRLRVRGRADFGT